MLRLFTKNILLYNLIKLFSALKINNENQLTKVKRRDLQPDQVKSSNLNKINAQHCNSKIHARLKRKRALQ